MCHISLSRFLPFSRFTYLCCSHTVTSRPLLTTTSLTIPSTCSCRTFPSRSEGHTQLCTRIAKFGFLSKSDVQTQLVDPPPCARLLLLRVLASLSMSLCVRVCALEPVCVSVSRGIIDRPRRTSWSSARGGLALIEQQFRHTTERSKNNDGVSQRRRQRMGSLFPRIRQRTQRLHVLLAKFLTPTCCAPWALDRSRPAPCE